MKSLKFRSHLADQILDGTKTVTWRLFDDKDLKIGDEIELIRWETGEVFGKATILDVAEKRLGDITDDDYEYSNYKRENQSERLEHYREIYGDKVNVDTMVKMIKLKLLNPNG